MRDFASQGLWPFTDAIFNFFVYRDIGLARWFTISHQLLLVWKWGVTCFNDSPHLNLFLREARRLGSHKTGLTHQNLVRSPETSRAMLMSMYLNKRRNRSSRKFSHCHRLREIYNGLLIIKRVKSGGGPVKLDSMWQHRLTPRLTRPLHVQHTYYRIIFKQNPFKII